MSSTNEPEVNLSSSHIAMKTYCLSTEHHNRFNCNNKYNKDVAMKGLKYICEMIISQKLLERCATLVLSLQDSTNCFAASAAKNCPDC